MEDLGPDYEDVFFNYGELAGHFDDHPVCWLVALDNFQLALVQASLKYAHWPSRWEGLGLATWDEVRQRVAELEECLMSGCQVSDLVTAISDLKDQMHKDLQALANKSVLPDLTDITSDVVSVGTDLLQLYTTFYYVALLTGVGAELLPPPPPLLP